MENRKAGGYSSRTMMLIKVTGILQSLTDDVLKAEGGTIISTTSLFSHKLIY